MKKLIPLTLAALIGFSLLHADTGKEALAKLTARIGDKFWSAPEKRLVRATIYKKEKGAGDGDSANPFGLYDTAGNVWEQMQDCWHAGNNGAPTDGSAWGPENGGDCGLRVIRGGSWINPPVYLRVSFRFSDGPGNRANNIGLRLAQDLD